MPGPPETPSAIRKLRGDSRPSQINQNEPQYKLVCPTPPKDLPPKACAEWKRVALVLFNARVLTEADLTTLHGYCICYARALEAEALVTKEGVRIEEQRGSGPILYTIQKENPAFAIATKARKQRMDFAAQLGLTPAARTKVNALPADAGSPLGKMRGKLRGLRKGLKLVK